MFRIIPELFRDSVRCCGGWGEWELKFRGTKESISQVRPLNDSCSTYTSARKNTLWFLLPLLILAALFKSAWFKGVIGEFIVNVASKLMLDKKEYRLIKNVTLPTEDGTTQIDHVIVSKYGIFVVETKNMKGWIFGDPKQSTWTQKIFKHTSKFQNPLHQNFKHVKTMEALLDLSDQQIHSLIVFVGESIVQDGNACKCYSWYRLYQVYKIEDQPVLSEGEVTDMSARLLLAG